MGLAKPRLFAEVRHTEDWSTAQVMLFPTAAFAAFFAVVYCGHWLLRRYRFGWRYFMLAASIFFYGQWNWRYVPLLIGSAVVNAFLARTVIEHLGPDRSKTDLSKRWVRIGVAANLALLGWFKYAGFLSETLINLANAIGWHLDATPLTVRLPIAISFFTFQGMSYVIDAGRGEYGRPARLLDVMLYISFFPHLVAGPIVRLSEFLPQLDRRPRTLDVGRATQLIAGGLFKKVVVASYLADVIVDKTFAAPAHASAWEAWLGMYAYAIQIYADFSGYTDIAIGIALLLGISFPQNFDSPYRSLSLQDFWRRWHMTLSRWLRDYLYIPLGGNRHGYNRTLVNLMLTMLLGGLWHGAAWTFVIWGAIHGGWLVVERIVTKRWHEYRQGVPLLDSRVSQVLRWTVTFHIVCLAWIFFRAPTFGIATEYLGALFGPLGSVSFNPVLIGLLIGAVAVQFMSRDQSRQLQRAWSEMPPIYMGIAFALALTVIDTLGPEGVAPFIYFQF